MSIELVMLSNHLILCRLLLLSPSIFPNIRVFSNESALHIMFMRLFASLFMGFSQQEYWGALPFPPPVDHVLSELLTMTHPSWVGLHGMAHSFIELRKALHHDKAVIHGEETDHTMFIDLRCAFSCKNLCWNFMFGLEMAISFFKIYWQGFHSVRIVSFFKILFLTWTIFKVFIQFITILLLLFMSWFFGPEVYGILVPLTRDQIHAPCIGAWSLNHGTTREIPELFLATII